MSEIRWVVSLALVVTALCATTVAAGAPQRHSAATGCTTTVDGHHWLVAPRGLSCGDGIGVVQKLAPKKVTASGKWPGTYAGMQCASTTGPGKKPQYIACGNASHSRSLMAFQG